MVLEPLSLLAGLSEQRFELLIIVIERAGSSLQFLISLRELRLLRLKLRYFVLQCIGVLRTAAKEGNDNPNRAQREQSPISS